MKIWHKLSKLLLITSRTHASNTLVNVNVLNLNFIIDQRNSGLDHSTAEHNRLTISYHAV